MAQSASRPMLTILEEKLDHYRDWTVKILSSAPDAWMYRPAGWTECTIGWHMGHVAWKLDSYGAIYLGREPALDSEWQRRFYSEAALDPAEAPSVADLRAVFADTHRHFLAALAGLSDDDLPRTDPAWPDGTLLGAIANVIMHEGEHLAGIEALVWSFQHDVA